MEGRQRQRKKSATGRAVMTIPNPKMMEAIKRAVEQGKLSEREAKAKWLAIRGEHGDDHRGRHHDGHDHHHDEASSR